MHQMKSTNITVCTCISKLCADCVTHVVPSVTAQKDHRWRDLKAFGFFHLTLLTCSLHPIPSSHFLMADIYLASPFSYSSFWIIYFWVNKAYYMHDADVSSYQVSISANVLFPLPTLIHLFQVYSYLQDSKYSHRMHWHGLKSQLSSVMKTIQWGRRKVEFKQGRGKKNNLPSLPELCVQS